MTLSASKGTTTRTKVLNKAKGARTGKTSILDGAVKIDGKLYTLNAGVQIWKRHGVDKLIVRVFLANGGTQTKSFAITPEGVKQANALAKHTSKEITSYGAEFGALSIMERQAIEFYRPYEKECVSQGMPPYGVLNVILHGIEIAKAATCGAPQV